MWYKKDTLFTGFLLLLALISFRGSCHFVARRHFLDALLRKNFASFIWLFLWRPSKTDECFVGFKYVYRISAPVCRPGYFYLFGENRVWNSRDNFEDFWKSKEVLDSAKQAMISIRVQQLQAFRQLMKISLVFPNLLGVKGLKTN